MADNAKLFRSFAGGVIAPEMYGRLDLDKFQTGLAQAENFIVLPHGPATNRPGLLYTNEARDSTRRVRVIRFAFNRQQTACVELGHNYIRFHTNNATILEASAAIGAISQAATRAIAMLSRVIAPAILVIRHLWLAVRARRREGVVALMDR